jgi:uncharacterized protein
MEAMKSRDAVATSAIRSALGAVDNAKSVGVTDRDVPVGADYIAGSVEGLGAGDVPQREMDDEQIIEIVLVGMRDREGVAGSTAPWAGPNTLLGFAPRPRSCWAFSRAKALA